MMLNYVQSQNFICVQNVFVVQVGKNYKIKISTVESRVLTGVYNMEINVFPKGHDK